MERLTFWNTICIGLLSGLSSQQSVVTARWFSNKTPLYFKCPIYLSITPSEKTLASKFSHWHHLCKTYIFINPVLVNCPYGWYMSFHKLWHWYRLQVGSGTDQSCLPNPIVPNNDHFDQLLSSALTLVSLHLPHSEKYFIFLFIQIR